MNIVIIIIIHEWFWQLYVYLIESIWKFDLIPFVGQAFGIDGYHPMGPSNLTLLLWKPNYATFGHGDENA